MTSKVSEGVKVLLSFTLSYAILLTSWTGAQEDSKVSEDKPKEVICRNNKCVVNDKEQPLVTKVGESVLWVNHDKVEHTATAEKDSPISFDVFIPKKDGDKPGRSKPVKFTKPGKIKYFCIPHKDVDMEGEIIVKESS